ncbi:MAG TPA: RAMP superfamily CRISPR-associated protein [Anaerolineales bacterium]|nr:RAMP superfamily CRISPR-associated protein [Anaerolineales bacterium]
MAPSKIRITIQSAATFGRGDGVAGLVDREIEHDENGLPYLRGKTLKGLLAESAENIVFALGDDTNWRTAKDTLFGKPGQGNGTRGTLHLGDATLTEGLRSALQAEIEAKALTAEDILHGLTGIRRQTAMNEYGAPEHASLRSMRVLLPGVVLEADIHIDDPTDEQLSLLTAACLDLRRAGTGRNRGRGHVLVELDDASTTKSLFDTFAKEVNA